MTKELRHSGLEVVGDVPWGTHFCQFYKTGQDLLDILVPYFSAGLRNNEFCMWITSEPLGVEAARAAMAAALPDFEDFVRRGQIEIIAHTDWYLEGGTFDSERVLAGWTRKLDGALASGYEGLRLTGNTFWLEPRDWRTFTDYEAAVDGVIGRLKMLAVCTYSLDRCGLNEVLDVISNHRFALVRREGGWELVESGESRRSREELKRLAQFPSENPNPVLRVTAGGEVIYANAPARALLAAMGWRESAPLPPALRGLAAEAHASRGVVEAADLADGLGKTFWFSAIRPAREPYVNVYAQDITRRKEAEETVRRNEEWLKVTLTSIGDGVIATGADGRLLFLNPVASELTGWAAEDAHGRPAGDVFRTVNELTGRPAEDLFARVLAENRAVEMGNNTALVCRDGHLVPIEDSAAPILDADGRLVGVVLVFHDVTAKRQAQQALRESEERFRSLFETMTEGFSVHEIITDDQGRPCDYRFLEVNGAFERLTGLRRGDLIGRRVMEVLPGTEPCWIESFGRVALTGEPLRMEEYSSVLDRWYDVLAYRTAPGRFAVVFTDVTERRKAEKVLRHHAGLLNAMSDAAISTDADFRIQSWNPAAERMYGWRAEEVLGRPSAAILGTEYPDGRTETADVVRSLAEFGIWAGEVIQRKRDGTPFDVAASISLLKDGAGRSAGVIAVNRDITERTVAEAALRESEGLLRRTQEIAHLGSWALDLPAGRLSWSDEVYRIFGLEPQEFGATYEAFLDRIHPDDRTAVDAAYSGSVRDNRSGYEIEHRIVRKNDGEVRIVHERCEHQRDLAGRIVRSIGMVHDITEQRKTEALRLALAEQERLRLGVAVEQASDAIVMADLDGTIRYVNAAFESINRLPRDQAVGRSYACLIAADPSADAIGRAIALGRPWHGQLVRPVSGGRPIEIEVTISAARDPSGRLLGALVNEKDVTRENALERQIRQTQKMEALGTLAGGITHDFNNILGAIIINTELALFDLDPSSPARRPLPLVLQAAGRGKELVKQIITFSRQREWDRAPIEAAPVVKEALKFLRSTLAKDIAIHETIDSGGGTVLGDPSQIHQIVVNLCQNAALAMRDKGGNLEVKLEPVEVDAAVVVRNPDLVPGPHVRLTVADTGCGMSRDLMERIFEPFFTTRDPGEGSGLGLAVVHGIVKSYNGAITVYSEPGRGSVFNVYLPRLEEKAPAAAAIKPIVPAGGQERLLLVEDEEAQRTSLSRSLQKLGYRVTARAGGRSALTVFRKDPAAFDLVITDQTMPGMSGLELATALLKIRPDVPVLLCTGFSEKVNGGSVGHAGIREFLMKPFTLQEISRAIRKALEPGSGS